MLPNIRSDDLKNLRKLGILTLSTGLTIGILAPGVNAESLVNGEQTQVKIHVAQAEKVVAKSELIKKFKQFFPTEFNFLDDNDFHMYSGHRFSDDETIRYDLSFHKTVNGKRIYGNIGFFGESLEIERFSYQPADAADALFPAKITKEKAKEAAMAFLKKFPENGEYQLNTEHNDFFPRYQILTEPIRYSFSFVKMKNKIPVSDQQIQITVLGNGMVGDFYRGLGETGSLSYDDAGKVLPEKDIISKMKENLSVDLRYAIHHDYQTGKSEVNLVYQPVSEINGVHALTGDWRTAKGFSSELPKENKLKRIVNEPISPKQTKISLEDAKKFAEKLLAIDSDEYKLRIESVDEMKNHNGQEVISINYMYESRNGGSGTNLELDKHTGEIVQYHDLKTDLLNRSGKNGKQDKQISGDEALKKAVEYLKQYSPSYLYNYAMVSEESVYDTERGVYYFSFPRIENDILVSGDQISVSVSGDGSLLGLNAYRSDIKNWPTIEKTITKEKALEKFTEQLTVDLSYTKVGAQKDNKHYHLVYSPKFTEHSYSFLDAKTGEWKSFLEERSDRKVVSHPWAEKELNHLINTGILKVEDAKKFDPDAQVTKGEAIEIIMKSLTWIYPEYYFGQRNKVQSFKNINSEHALYQVVERAVSLGILKKDKDNFDFDKPLTREELAVWYVRTLGLEQAAKNQGIYKLTFADAKDVSKENIGFVALAHSLDLLSASNNKFNPKQHVTYAQLAVSDVRLAHEVYNKGIEIHY